MANFAERLKEFLDESHKDIKEFAVLWKVDLSEIYSWLRGECLPSCPNITKIADCFECSVEYLLGRKETEYEFNAKTDRKSFSQKFNEILTENKVTEYRFVKDTGLSRDKVSSWRKGNRLPKISSLVVISEYFGITIDCLLDRE